MATKGGAVSRESEARLAETVMRKVYSLRQAAGPRFDQIELSSVAAVIVTDRREEAAERFAREQGWNGIGPAVVLEMPSVFIGTISQISTDMRMRREQFGFSYYVFSDHVMEDVAPIVGRLAGT